MAKKPTPPRVAPPGPRDLIDVVSLSFPEARDSKQQRGSPIAVVAQLKESTVAEANVELLQYVTETLLAEAKKPFLDVDSLQPRQVAELVSRQLEMQSDWEELKRQPGRAGLCAQFQWLRELRSAKPTKALRWLNQVTAQLVNEQTESLRNLLVAFGGDHCCSIKPVVDEARNLLAALVFGEPSHEAFSRCGNLLSALEAVERFPKLSAARKEALSAFLQEEARACLSEAATSIARNLANEAVRAAVNGLLPLLDEIEGQEVTCRRNLDLLAKELRERVRRGQAVVTEMSSIFIDLPVQPVESHLAAAKANLQVEDRGGLGREYLIRWVHELRELARGRYPHLNAQSAGLGRLLPHLEIGDLADAFERVTRAAIEAEHSVYAAMNLYGVTQLASDLLARAQPTVDLAGRNIPQLCVEPQVITQVRLPEPRSAAEQEVQQQFLRACYSLEPACRIVEGPAEEREVMITRLVVGFPIAVLADNEVLLSAYGACGEINHLPHLFGISPDFSGVAEPRLAEFARQREALRGSV